MSASPLELELQTGCLAVLSAEGFPIMRQWYVLHRTQHRLSASATTFRDMVLALDPAGKPHMAHKRGARVRASA